MTEGVLLVSHGTVDDLRELPEFLTSVRRGQPPPPEMLAELRRRYEAIGGRSPLNRINDEVAGALGRRLGLPVMRANRLSNPKVRPVLEDLARRGVDHAAVVPLAQFSGAVYADDARRAAEGTGVAVSCAPSWGGHPGLCAAFAARIVAALGAPPVVEGTTVLMTAHSLPRSVIDAGDPYEQDLRAAAVAIASLVRERLGRDVRWQLAFQSQGMGTGPGGRPIAWLGPDLGAALDEAAASGARRVVLAPIGFLADHVEVLYDLDIEARAMAEARGLAYARAASLNADADLVEVLAAVAGPLLRHG
jgi:ferrochelatase